MRKAASIAAIVFGVALIAAAATTWFVVSDTLRDQNITTAEDACLHDRTVAGPFTAYCQAKIIDEHTLGITDGRTYAELDRDDPLRATAMNSAFLQASLFTSVLAFGVSAMAAGMGVLFILIGLGMRDVRQLGEPARTPDMNHRESL
jgi:cbb3-type cytochrome oxidase subunit 1